MRSTAVDGREDWFVLTPQEKRSFVLGLAQSAVIGIVVVVLIKGVKTKGGGKLI